MTKATAALWRTSALALFALSTAASAQDAAADPAAAKARAKQVAEWRKAYGEGPYPDEIDSFVSARKEPLRPYYKALYTGGERNAVLNFSRLGLAAMELGHWTDAERAFDAALVRIEAVYSRNKAAEAAKSIWHNESNKEWKGEPYERAMAYYYRGLLYLRKGDYNNAHAAFKDAEFQDTVSEGETFQSDFALMNYLIGWSAQCAGDNGAGDFAEAAKAQAALKVPAKNDNVLFVAELGHGPIKVKGGKMREKLEFQRAEGYPETGAVFTLSPVGGAAAKYDGLVASSLYDQASTRGKRAMDGIQNNKTAVKKTSAGVGVGLIALSSQANNSSAGGAMALAGLAALMFSSTVKTEADTRMWDSLPDGVTLATGHAAGAFKSDVVFINGTGSIAIPPTPIMQATAGKCSIVWVRSRSALLDAETPGDDLKVRAAVARKKDIQLKDKSFRVALANDFKD